MSPAGEPASARPLTARLADRRRRMAMAEITRVALDLFAERSFAEVTVDDIAAAAGISQRTFFRYFASKDDLLLQFECHLQKRLLDAFEGRPANEGAVTALRRAYVSTSTVADSDRERSLMLGRLIAAAPTLRGRLDADPVIEQLVAALARRMGLDPTVDDRPAVVTAAMQAAATTAWDRWVADGGPGDAGARIDTALALLADGLGVFDKISPRRNGARR